jgi:hypothetical protein
MEAKPGVLEIRKFPSMGLPPSSCAWYSSVNDFCTSSARRERNTLAAAYGDLEAEQALEQPQAMAQGAARDAKLFRRFPHRAQAGERVQCTQSVHWRVTRLLGVQNFHLDRQNFTRLALPWLSILKKSMRERKLKGMQSGFERR